MQRTSGRPKIVVFADGAGMVSRAAGAYAAVNRPGPWPFGGAGPVARPGQSMTRGCCSGQWPPSRWSRG
jgi:hypothetical protein